jgi:hypothetical protein
MPLMFRTKISVEEALPFSKEVFRHFFNDHSTDVSAWTGSHRLQTGYGLQIFIVNVEDIL